MKKYVLITHSDSGDRYTYFIKSKVKPAPNKLTKFLLVNAVDKDEDFVYENVEYLVEIIEENFKII